MMMLYILTRLGTAEKVSEDVKNMLKRDPISFDLVFRKLGNNRISRI